MKITVLYQDDGRIVSFQRVSEREADNPIAATLRSGVDASEGQRVAHIALDPAWHDRLPADILQHCIVVHDGHEARLQDRGEQKAD